MGGYNLGQKVVVYIYQRFYLPKLNISCKHKTVQILQSNSLQLHCHYFTFTVEINLIDRLVTCSLQTIGESAGSSTVASKTRAPPQRK